MYNSKVVQIAEYFIERISEVLAVDSEVTGRGPSYVVQYRRNVNNVQWDA